MENNKPNRGVITEQGDLGLGAMFFNEHDRKVVEKEEQRKRSAATNTSKQR